MTPGRYKYRSYNYALYLTGSPSDEYLALQQILRINFRNFMPPKSEMHCTLLEFNSRIWPDTLKTFFERSNFSYDVFNVNIDKMGLLNRSAVLELKKEDVLMSVQRSCLCIFGGTAGIVSEYSENKYLPHITLTAFYNLKPLSHTNKSRKDLLHKIELKLNYLNKSVVHEPIMLDTLVLMQKNSNSEIIARRSLITPSTY